MNINICETETEKYIRAVKEIKPEGGLCTVITFGCQQNEADSEKIRGMAAQMGYAHTENPEDADIIVVNTCAIRQHAEEKALSMLGRFKAIKRKNPNLIVGVVGCMAAEAHVCEMLKKDFHYISFTLEPSMLYRFPELVFINLSDKKRTFVYGEDRGDVIEGIPAVRSSEHRAWVSIMYGCNNFCSYCIVPYVRGRERSRESSEIILETKQLVSQGCKEITLLGQNVNSYRSDMDFAELLEAIAKIEGDFIIRFMTSHPKDVSDALVRVMGEYSGKIAPYFHLPLQSGSDSILKAMNRTYDRKGFLNTVNRLREAVPDIALSSDVIVGFPGESEEDFEDTLDMLRKVRFDMVYSFIYSRREGTRAAAMPNHIDDSIKSERMSRLLDLQCAISKEKNEPYLGRTVRVLVDGVDKSGGCNTYSARTMTNKLVHFTSDECCIGQFKEIKINRIGAFDLFGEEI